MGKKIICETCDEVIEGEIYTIEGCLCNMKVCEACYDGYMLMEED